MADEPDLCHLVERQSVRIHIDKPMELSCFCQRISRNCSQSIPEVIGGRIHGSGWPYGASW